MRLLALALTLIPTLAWGTSYLPESDVPTATARSITEGQAMGVPDGSPWWGVLSLPCTTGPTVFIALEDSPRAISGYDFTANPIATQGPNAGQATGLSQAELATVLSQSTLQANGCFPVSP